jgi:hypothetical protein
LFKRSKGEEEKDKEESEGKILQNKFENVILIQIILIVCKYFG